MTSAELELRRAVLFANTTEAMRLGDPVPAVSLEVANIVIDLLEELNAAIAEVRRLEALSARGDHAAA